MEVHYFKRLQHYGLYHYYKVYGGRGKTKDGYQEVINFLNENPIIYVEKNYESDPSGIEGTWSTFETGEPITKEVWEEAYQIATEGDFDIR